MASPLPGPGDEFAGYRIQRELGRGGMGIVYLAEQQSLHRRVALKLITPALGDDEQFRRRFESEAQHAASLEHPNVVPVYEAGSFQGHLFLAMRYIDGIDLGGRLRASGHLEAPEAALITREIGSALDAAHRRGLIHRDVKPANILLDGEGEELHAYLSDFGLTKDLQGASLTGTGQWVGTMDYVAPEQLEGHNVDARTDVYSLACVLYEMLAGQPPYQGIDAHKMWAHMHDPPPSLGAFDAALAARFDPVIARGMAKRKQDRYPSAGDLGRAAQATASGAAVTAPERSVASGAAATGLRETALAETPAEPAERAAPPSAEDATRVIPPRRGVRWLPIAAGLVAVAAVAAVVAVVLSSGGSEGSGAQSTVTQPAGTIDCGNEVFAEADATSCPFAVNVAETYRSMPGSEEITAFSPTTGKSYRLHCIPGSPTVCTTDTDASVYIG